MKSNWFFLMIITFALGACNKQVGCNMNELNENDGIAVPEKCDYCINYSSSEIPELLSDDYNDAVAVYRNFTYYVKQASEYPYYSHKGDTLKMRGFIIEKATDTLSLSNHETNPIGGYPIVIKLIDSSSLVNNIDESEECLVTGVLDFPSTENMVFSADKCQRIPFIFHVVEISN